MVLSTTYAKHAKWISDKEVCWTFSDWTPKSDMIIRVLKWSGLPGKNEIYAGFKLPKIYTADKRAYTETFLNTLVKAEMDKYNTYFPKQIENVDRAQLKVSIATILYHEIYARHNYAFVMGKYIGEPGWEPGGVSVAPDKIVFGRWYGYFTPYLLHGGWYKPDRGLSLEEVKEMLNNYERANLAFLNQQGAQEDTFTLTNVEPLIKKGKNDI